MTGISIKLPLLRSDLFFSKIFTQVDLNLSLLQIIFIFSSVIDKDLSPNIINTFKNKNTVNANLIDFRKVVFSSLI